MDARLASYEGTFPVPAGLAAFRNGDPEAAHCPCCGNRRGASGQAGIGRGAVQILRDPLQVTWRGKIVPLSPTEAEVFAAIAVPGRTSLARLDAVIRDFGSNPATRRMVMMRIRRKFAALGAADPIELVGNWSVRLRIEPVRERTTSTEE
jgi:hypothetical protein